VQEILQLLLTFTIHCGKLIKTIEEEIVFFEVVLQRVTDW